MRSTSIGLFTSLSLLTACETGTPCESSSECASTEICYQSRCDYAFDRYYDVIIIEAEVPETYPDGGDWDFDGSAPDLYVETGFSGQSNGCYTHTVYDTISPFWEAECSIWVPDMGTFLLNIWDEDEGENDDEFAYGFYWEGAQAFTPLLKSDGNALTADDESERATITFTLVPY